MIGERLRGVFAALGPDPDWYRFFDTTRAAMRRSFIPALLSIPFYGLIASATQTERAQRLNSLEVDVPWAPFILVMLAYTFAFPFVAVISGTLFDKSDRWPAWITVRHWTMFFLAALLGILYLLTEHGPLPFAVANTAGFAAWLGMLAIDIRLAQKVGGMGLGASVLIGSIITTLGLSLILASLLLYIG